MTRLSVFADEALGRAIREAAKMRTGLDSPDGFFAVALGKQLVADGRTDARVATIFCDSGFRYLSTIFNADWLRDKGLPVFDWLRD